MGKTKEDVAVRERREDAVDGAGYAFAAEDLEEYEAAIEARTKARLARAVPPLTWSAQDEQRCLRDVGEDAGYCLGSELGQLRAALAASREESADLRAQLAAVMAERDAALARANGLNGALHAKLVALQAAVSDTLDDHGGLYALRDALGASRV